MWDHISGISCNVGQISVPSLLRSASWFMNIGRTAQKTGNIALRPVCSLFHVSASCSAPINSYIVFLFVVVVTVVVFVVVHAMAYSVSVSASAMKGASEK